MRAQLKHVLLDVDFLNNPKIRTLKTKFGQLAQLCLIDVYSAMSKATNAVIDEDCLLSILSEYQLNDTFLAYCLDKRLIHTEMNGYSNSVVIKDQEAYYRKLNSGKKRNNSEQKCSEKILERGKSGHENAIPDNDSVYVYDNDLNKKNSQPPVQPELIKLSEFVRLSQFNREMFKKRCLDEKFTAKETKEIIESLDRWFAKNQEKWREEDHFRDLCSWPMKQAREEKAKLERARGSPKIGVIEKPHPITSVRPKGF